MAEGWIGEAAMRVGLRAYMKKHAHAGGTTADIFAALDGATDKPVSAMLASFTNQPGVPRVDVSLRCEGPPRMVIRQERHLRSESQLDRARLWKIPVCFRYPVDGLVTSSCVLLEGSELEVPLEGKACPVWLHPNPDERGYYRWSVPPGVLAQLVGPYRSALTLREKMALLPHLWALVTADQLPAKTYLEAIDQLAEETHPLVIARVAGALSSLAAHARGLGIEGDLAKRIQTRLGGHASRIGDVQTKGETPRTTMLRNHLRSVLGDAGRDPALRKAAREKTDTFLGDPSQVPEGLGTAMAMAAWDGDQALFGRLLEVAQTKVSPQVRTELVRAMGSFSDPALTVRGLDAVIDGPLRTQDLRVIYGSTGRTPETRQAAWSWIERRYDDIVSKMGTNWAVKAPRAASPLCDPALRGRVVKFFEGAGRTPPGSERNLGLALERIDECLSDRARMKEPLGPYLLAR
jgi:alanyl aminopeptidase